MELASRSLSLVPRPPLEKIFRGGSGNETIGPYVPCSFSPPRAPFSLSSKDVEVDRANNHLAIIPNQYLLTSHQFQVCCA